MGLFPEFICALVVMSSSSSTEPVEAGLPCSGQPVMWNCVTTSSSPGPPPACTQYSERGKTLAVESVVIAHTHAITKLSSTVESSVNDNCFFYCNHIFVVFPTRMPFYFRLSVPLQSIAISTAVTHSLSYTIDHHTCSPTTSSFREVKSPSEVWDCSVTVILPY